MVPEIKVQILGVKVNFLKEKIIRGNLNSSISANEIASFRLPRIIFLKRKLTLRHYVNFNEIKFSLFSQL